MMKRWKKCSFTIMTALICSLCAPSLLPSAQPAAASAAVKAKVKLNKKKLTLTVGKTAVLKLSGTKAKVKWTSSNKAAATVTQKGKVKGVKAGTAKITAAVNKKKYTCTVTVQAPVNPDVKNAPFEAREETINKFTLILPKNYKAVKTIDNAGTLQIVYVPEKYADSQNSPAGISVTTAYNGMPAMSFDDLKSVYDPVIDKNVEAIKSQGAVFSVYGKSEYENRYGKALVYDLTFEYNGMSQRQKSYIFSFDDYLFQIDIIKDADTDTGSPDIFEAGAYLLEHMKIVK